MKVYSPSDTTTFMRCPQLWWYRKQGWENKTIGNPDCAAAVGLGVGRGMELYHRFPGEYRLGGEQLTALIQMAVECGTARLQSRLDTGAHLLPAVEKTWELVPHRIEKVIRGFHKRKPLPLDWHDFLTERKFPDYGNCRIDVMCQSDLGPCIVDWKTKVTAKDYRIDEFLFDAETSWQMYHYVWAARQMGIQVDSFAIVLIVVEPLQFFVEQWLVDEEYLKRWEADARQWWILMHQTERGEVQPLRTGEHRTNFGLCSHYGMCFTAPWMEYIHRPYVRKEESGDSTRAN